MDEELSKFYKAINWRQMPHNHQDVDVIKNTCPLCVIEDALFGGKD